MNKLLLFFSVLFISCLSQAQALRGGGGGGRPSAMMAMRCTEGQSQPFTVFDHRGSQYTEWRTCTDGRFFPRQEEVKPVVCKQGTQALFSELNSSGRYQEVWKFCYNGRFISRQQWEQLQSNSY